MDEVSLMHYAILLEHSEGGRGDIIRMITPKYEHRDGGAIADENEMCNTSVCCTVAR